MWAWAEWLSRSPHIWELLLCCIKCKHPSRLSRSTPIFCFFFFFNLASPALLLPWIMDSWIHSFFKLNGMKDLGLDSRGITKMHVTGVTSTLPALLCAAGWSVFPVCEQLLLEAQTRFQVYQLLKATCYLPVQAFNSMQIPKIWFPRHGQMHASSVNDELQKVSMTLNSDFTKLNYHFRAGQRAGSPTCD